jgi:DNA-binding transcriptional LysR family regulator
MEAFRAGGLAHSYVSVITVSAEARISLVKSGRFLTIFPASALRFSAKQSGIAVLPVELPIAPVPNGIVTLKNRTLSPVVRLFIEQARTTAKTSIDR